MQRMTDKEEQVIKNNVIDIINDEFGVQPYVRYYVNLLAFEISSFIYLYIYVWKDYGGYNVQLDQYRFGDHIKQDRYQTDFNHINDTVYDIIKTLKPPRLY